MMGKHKFIIPNLQMEKVTVKLLLNAMTELEVCWVLFCSLDP